MNSQEFITQHVKVLKPLSKKLALAYWKASISGSDEDFKEYEELAKELKKIFNNKEEFEKTKTLFSQEQDPITKRQLKILHNEYLSSQGDLDLINQIIEKETKVEQKFNKFRANLEGKELTDNDIKEILKSETDSQKLQAAWEASKKQGELVEKDMLEIIKLRNNLAKSLGFKNYYEFSLQVSEQKPEEIISTFQELADLTNKPFAKLKDEINTALSEKYNISKEDLKPWHHQDLFFQEGPEIYKIDINDIYANHNVVKIAEEFYKGIGIPVTDVLEKSDLYEKPGKSQHAFCIAIDREGDVRILQNVKNNEKWMETTLHELGHAIYSKLVCTPKLPYLLRDQAHIFTTEAIALLFGRKSKDLSFIKKYCQKEDPSLAEKLPKALRLRQLVFSRWTQVMVNFERQFYENPDQDLNKLWWSLVTKHQLIPFSRDKPDWASKMHFVAAPVYYHNYMLGELLASQIHHHITKNILNQDSLKNVDYSGKKEIGLYLQKHIFEQGMKCKWDEMIKKATGEELTPEYYVEEFVEGA